MTSINLPTRLIATWIDAALSEQRQRLVAQNVNSWRSFAATVQCRQQVIEATRARLREAGPTIEIESVHAFIGTKVRAFAEHFDTDPDLFVELQGVLGLAADNFSYREDAPVLRELWALVDQDLERFGLGPYAEEGTQETALLAACRELESLVDGATTPADSGDDTCSPASDEVSVEVFANRVARSLAGQYEWLRGATRYPADEVSLVISIVSTIERSARAAMLDGGFSLRIPQFEKLLLQAEEDDKRRQESGVGLISSTYGQVIREVCHQPKDELREEVPGDYDATQPPVMQYFDDDPHYFRNPDDTAQILLCLWSSARAERNLLSQTQCPPLVHAEVEEAILPIEEVMMEIRACAGKWIDVHTVREALERKHQLFTSRPSDPERRVDKLFNRVIRQTCNDRKVVQEEELLGVVPRASAGPNDPSSVYRRLTKAIQAECLRLPKVDSWSLSFRDREVANAIDHMELIVSRLIVSAALVVDVDGMRRALREKQKKLAGKFSDAEGLVRAAFENVIREVCD